MIILDMTKELYLLDEDIIIFLHELVMKDADTKGIRDKANLEYAVHEYKQPRYKEVLVKAAALLFNIIRGHCFLDGNKRTALVSTAAFLLFNGYELEKLPLVYADYLLNVAKEASNIKDEDVLDYIKHIAGELEKYTKKLSKSEQESMNYLAESMQDILDSFKDFNK
ncbi:Fic/DOC family protein [Candidatus Tiddalikarchaeum anstoanum]|nr:Fic/DOC family protein [Candidatus Tiddalikarchaeum anstoanum]